MARKWRADVDRLYEKYRQIFVNLGLCAISGWGYNERKWKERQRQYDLSG
jgi:Ni,Fe-hydrogenase III small subunit